ncbi:MAG: cation transporter [Eubacteriales bacterium]|nr:cation transporter [Eubacteriales bacterium]MDD4474689.1 cation transporter [Eubacteriales bacterium]
MKNTFRLKGLGCASCGAKIEKALNKLEGVEKASVNFIMSKITVETKEEVDGLFESVKKIVAKYEPDVTVKVG